MGYARDIYNMLKDADDGKSEENNQLFYTRIYLDENKRKEFQIQLDHRSEIFQNLNEESGADFQLILGIITDLRLIMQIWNNNYVSRKWAKCKEQIIQDGSTCDSRKQGDKLLTQHSRQLHPQAVEWRERMHRLLAQYDSSR